MDISLLEDWENFYFNLFDCKIDLLNLKVPEKKEGFDRLIVVIPGMTPKILYNKCASLFKCDTPDRSKFARTKAIQSERNAKNGTYAVWLRNTIEADEDLKNLSTDDLVKRGIHGVTLEERLLYELKYFKETGRHLDVETATLCAGSCSPSSDINFVPVAYWSSKNKRFCISWVSSNVSSPTLRSRQVVL